MFQKGPGVASELIQIYYREEQKASFFPFAVPYFNERLTVFFENDPIKKLVLASNAEKIAVCSWKLREKLRWYIGKHRELTPEVMESDYDVLSFTRNTKHHGMLYSANKYHYGFKEAFQKICSNIGLVVPGEVKTPIYQNHFSARREIYQDYVKNYLSKAMDFMVTEEMWDDVTIDSNYATLNRSKSVDADYLREQIGFPYYPLAPFLLERLFSVYVHNKKIRVTPL